MPTTWILMVLCVNENVVDVFRVQLQQLLENLSKVYLTEDNSQLTSSGLFTECSQEDTATNRTTMTNESTEDHKKSPSNYLEVFCYTVDNTLKIMS
jgi:hypothetical protein